MMIATRAFVSRSFRRPWVVVLLALSVTTCGGSNPAAPPSPAPAPTPVPATLEDLSASTTLPEAGHDMNCRDDIHGRVTLTSPRATSSIG